MSTSRACHKQVYSTPDGSSCDHAKPTESRFFANWTLCIIFFTGHPVIIVQHLITIYFIFDITCMDNIRRWVPLSIYFESFAILYFGIGNDVDWGVVRNINEKNEKNDCKLKPLRCYRYAKNAYTSVTHNRISYILYRYTLIGSHWHIPKHAIWYASGPLNRTRTDWKLHVHYRLCTLLVWRFI